MLSFLEKWKEREKSFGKSRKDLRRLQTSNATHALKRYDTAMTLQQC